MSHQSNLHTSPRLALIAGESAGIGPELCVRLAQSPLAAQLIAYADPDLLLRAARRIGLPLALRDDDGSPHVPGTLALHAIPQPREESPGTLDAANAPHVIATLHAAADAARRGEIDALVTGPVHKGIVNDAGIAYTGTTELLAQHAGVEVAMMLASDTLRVGRSRHPASRDTSASLRVVLATTHLPLRAVPDAITRDGLLRTLRILHAALRCDFGIATPRIAVLGLNPHAGEGGYLGREEIDVIEPAIAIARAEGMQLDGPLPADTAFLPAKLAGFDAVFAMYHDQGLPVLKHGGFERAINITLGLPYIRCAVDHGTALDLAGRGVADASSLILAARTAAELAVRRRAQRG